jgi:hypothetical protein
MPFEPIFTTTPRIASNLMRIEAAKEAVQHLPITPTVLASLRESARLFSTHYSTMIEGNRLTPQQVTQVIAKVHPIPTHRPQSFTRLGRARLPARSRSCKEKQEIHRLADEFRGLL